MGSIQQLTPAPNRKELFLYQHGFGEGVMSSLALCKWTYCCSSSSEEHQRLDITPANKMPKQPSCTYKGRGNSRNFSGEMGFHGNCSHVSWAKWGPCRRFQKTLNLSSQPETEATGKRYPLLRKPEFTLAFPVSPYNNKLLLQSQVLPGMAHYPYNKAKPKEHIRKLTGSALWRSNYWELLRTENLPQNKDRLKSIWGLCSIPVDGGERGCERNWQLLSCQGQPSFSDQNSQLSYVFPHSSPAKGKL